MDHHKCYGDNTLKGCLKCNVDASLAEAKYVENINWYEEKNGMEYQNEETKRVGYMKMVWNTRMER